MDEETKRATVYLNASSLNPLMSVCEKVLIEAHLEKFNAEFKRLFALHAIDELTRLYKLVSRSTSGVAQLKKKLEEFIHKQGLDAIKQIENASSPDPSTFVETILSVHKKYSSMVSQAFANDPGFVAALDKACQKFINTNAITAICSQASVETGPADAQETEKSAELQNDQKPVDPQQHSSSSVGQLAEAPKLQQPVSAGSEQAAESQSKPPSATPPVPVSSSVNKSAELLARYVDNVLKKGSKVINEKETEEMLSNAVS